MQSIGSPRPCGGPSFSSAAGSPRPPCRMGSYRPRDRLRIILTCVAALTCRSFTTPLVASLVTLMVQRESSPEFVAIPIDGEPITGRFVNLTNPWRIVLQVGDRVSMTGPDLVAL